MVFIHSHYMLVNQFQLLGWEEREGTLQETPALHLREHCLSLQRYLERVERKKIGRNLGIEINVYFTQWKNLERRIILSRGNYSSSTLKCSSVIK